MTGQTETICAVSTAPGVGGIAVVRVSGPDALGVLAKIWRGKDIDSFHSHTAHYGTFLDSHGEPLDSGLATIFRAPNSYTGEDTVEISVHGSRYIQHELLQSLMKAGARMADPGEFTRRAFASNRLDMAQAEAVADIIAAESKAAHRLARTQVSGRYSRRINELHDRLLNFASLLELELDFSEEDVEFASRPKLIELANEILHYIDTLTDSYRTGKALKDGIPTAIVGETNAGKSTLLNLLVDDDIAIVSDIHGTTRDTIEATAQIGGVIFRFIDTAGLRETSDPIEAIGISRAKTKINSAAVLIWIVDTTSPEDIPSTWENIATNLRDDTSLIVLLNKIDLLTDKSIPSDYRPAVILDCPMKEVSYPFTPEHSKKAQAPSGSPSTLSMRTPQLSRNPTEIGKHLDNIYSHALEARDSSSSLSTPTPSDASRRLAKIKSDIERLPGFPAAQATMLYTSANDPKSLIQIRAALEKAAPSLGSDIAVTNARHQELLSKAASDLTEVIQGLHSGLPTDLVAQTLRSALTHLSSITGPLPSPTLLSHIFSHFCIGK